MRRIMENTYTICFDIGGSTIKAAVLNNACNPICEIQTFPSMAAYSKDVILQNFAHIFGVLLAYVPDKKSISGIRLAFPGDFDYENGICLIKGIAKYDALFQTNLKEAFCHLFQTEPALSPLCGVPVSFLNDVSAFALGESFFGKAHEFSKVIYLCIGTGCGSAFTVDNSLCIDETQGIPSRGWIYCTPFKDSIIDDYISIRGLKNLSISFMKEPLFGLDLFHLAQKDNPDALACFSEFGNRIQEAVSPFLESFSPDCFVFGGQISKSFPYFSKSFLPFCKEKNIYVYHSTQTSLRTLQGLSLMTDHVMK